MGNEYYQYTSDPVRIEHLQKVGTELASGRTATVEMYSGIVYTGTTSGGEDRKNTVNGKISVARYIMLATPEGKFRLDGLDIKSWSVK